MAIQSTRKLPVRSGPAEVTQAPLSLFYVECLLGGEMNLGLHLYFLFIMQATFASAPRSLEWWEWKK